ncbi:MAG: hypothetical protein V4772_20060, partial [Pseudomonadota bacterium]
MSYATIPRPGTVGDNVHTKTSSLLEQLMSMNIRNPNAHPSPFAPNEAQSAALAAKDAQQKEADAVTSDQRARESAANQEAYTRGWGNKKAPEPSAAQVDPEAVMSVMNAMTGQEQTSSEAPAGPNMSVMTPEMVAQLAAGKAPLAAAVPGKKSSTARADSSKPIDAKAAANPAAATDVMQSPAAADAIKEMLEGKQKTAEGDRDSAKAKALQAKDLSGGEKIFTALMAVLPGLVGAIGGGAIAGGHGAAAGAAGGLSGGAKAVGNMMGEKEQLRQEALAQEAAAQGRVDQAGNQLMSHQEHLGDQAFQTARQEDSQNFSAAKTERSMAHADANLAKSMSHADKNQLQLFKHQMAMKKMDDAQELLKLTAKGSGIKADDSDA